MGYVGMWGMDGICDMGWDGMELNMGWDIQGGQNVRIVRVFYFLTLNLYGMYGLYGFFSNCTDFYPGNTPFF